MSEFINHVPGTPETQQQAQQGLQAAEQLTTHYHLRDPDYAMAKLGELSGQAETLDQATKVQEIITQGKDGAHTLPDALVSRDGDSEMEFRLKMAELFVKVPETYEALRDHNIAGFHGTRSITLAGMLEVGGLVSTARANALDTKPLLVSGEHIYQGKEGQSSISFSQIGYEDQAGSYAAYKRDTVHTTEEKLRILKDEVAQFDDFIAQGSSFAAVAEAGKARHLKAVEELTAHPDSLRSTLLRHDFPVLVGISADFLEQDEEANGGARNLQHGQSSMGEFRPFSQEIPMDALPVLAVPRDKMTGVKQLFAIHGHPDLAVVPLEDLMPERPRLAV